MKISVIIPVYNVEKYLRECLDSVLAQTYSDLEVVCVNDGATDGSLAILNEYALKDDRIKIITQKNQGISMARNNGVKVATGDYIYFLDSDDWIHPQLIEICCHLATKYKADLVNFDFSKESSGDSIEVKNIDLTQSDIMVTSNPVFLGSHKEKYRISFCVWSKFFKRNLIKDILFIKGITGEDYPYTFAVLSKKPKTVVLKEQLYFYRYNPQSLSHKKSTPKEINDYKVGVLSICDIYEKSTLKKELSFLKRKLFPKILKLQYGICKRASKDVQKEMFVEFAQELRILKTRGVLSLLGCGIKFYYRYLKIIKKFT